MVETCFCALLSFDDSIDCVECAQLSSEQAQTWTRTHTNIKYVHMFGWGWFCVHFTILRTFAKWSYNFDSTKRDIQLNHQQSYIFGTCPNIYIRIRAYKTHLIPLYLWSVLWNFSFYYNFHAFSFQAGVVIVHTPVSIKQLKRIECPTLTFSSFSWFVLWTQINVYQMLFHPVISQIKSFIFDSFNQFLWFNSWISNSDIETDWLVHTNVNENENERMTRITWETLLTLLGVNLYRGRVMTRRILALIAIQSYL